MDLAADKPNKYHDNVSEEFIREFLQSLQIRSVLTIPWGWIGELFVNFSVAYNYSRFNDILGRWTIDRGTCRGIETQLTTMYIIMDR